MDRETLEAKLQALVAEAGGGSAGPGMRARDPVNQPMIRHWCDAIGDENPVYTDPEAAAESLHGGVVAPPTMLQAWTMQGLRPKPASAVSAEPAASAAPAANESGSAYGLLDQAGYTSVVATDCEQDYLRYLRPGDDLRVTQELESISGEKRTALGVGYFVTTLHRFVDGEGDVVGEMRFRILKFKPASAGAPEAAR